MGGTRTSEVMIRSSSHIKRGSMFCRKSRLMSDSTISSSESRGRRGNDAGEVLHDLIAQVRKLRVKSFISAVVDNVGG